VHSRTGEPSCSLCLAMRSVRAQSSRRSRFSPVPVFSCPSRKTFPVPFPFARLGFFSLPVLPPNFRVFDQCSPLPVPSDVPVFPLIVSVSAELQVPPFRFFFLLLRRVSKVGILTEVKPHRSCRPYQLGMKLPFYPLMLTVPFLFFAHIPPLHFLPRPQHFSSFLPFAAE